MKKHRCFSVAAAAIGHADERILSFHSDIRVMTDGMIEVTETIRGSRGGQSNQARYLS